MLIIIRKYTVDAWRKRMIKERKPRVYKEILYSEGTATQEVER